MATVVNVDRKLRDCHKHTMELENYRVSLEKAAITVRVSRR